jgi:hypothetical protein
MHYILGHNNFVLNLNPKTQVKKRLTIYNTSNGKLSLRKHVNLNHFIIFKEFKEEVNNLLRKKEKQPANNRTHISSSSISNFFCYKRTFQEI